MPGTVNDYLSKGFDKSAAKYFAGGRKKITSVSANDDFTLTLTFDGRERRLFDVRPLLEKGTVFEPFMDIVAFRRVYLDGSNCVSWDIDPTVDSEKVWSNKVDLCPDACYLDSIPL